MSARVISKVPLSITKPLCHIWNVAGFPQRYRRCSEEFHSLATTVWTVTHKSRHIVFTVPIHTLSSDSFDKNKSSSPRESISPELLHCGTDTREVVSPKTILCVSYVHCQAKYHLVTLTLSDRLILQIIKSVI